MADIFKLSQAEVYEVGSFYHHFKIVKEDGKKPNKSKLRICDGLSCELAGAHTLFDLVKDEQVNVGRSEFRQGDRIKDNGGMHAANILKNMKGNWDFDGVQKIGNDFYNADGEKMDNDDIEDFYYEQGYDEDDNNVGVELGRPLPSDTKPPTIENLNQLSKITTRYNK